MNNKVRFGVFSTALLISMVFQSIHGRPHQVSASELLEGIEEQIEEQIEEIEELIDPTHSIFGSHHQQKPGTPAGGTLPSGCEWNKPDHDLLYYNIQALIGTGKPT